MARLNTIFPFTGTFGKVTSVQSKTYGDHFRNARGTIKEAKLNDAFVKSQGAMGITNGYCQLIKNALDPYRGIVKDGKLWSRLSSHFRGQLRDHGGIEFGRLVNFEINNHALNRIVDLRVDAIWDAEANALNISLKPSCRAKFRSDSKITRCRYTIIALFINSVDQPATTASAQLFTARSSIEQIAISLPLEAAQSILICVKCEGFAGESASMDNKNTGMKIVAALKTGDGDALKI